MAPPFGCLIPDKTQPSSTMPTIWSFDLGKASLGEAVRGKSSADALAHLRAEREMPRKSRRAKLSLRSSEKRTLLNRCVRLADRETVCAI